MADWMITEGGLGNYLTRLMKTEMSFKAWEGKSDVNNRLEALWPRHECSPAL